MNIFDTHTHLNVAAFADDAEVVLQRALDADVRRLAIVGFDKETIERSLQLSAQHPSCYSIIGWHPTEAAHYDSAVERFVTERLGAPKVVALGEIGLDYYWKTATPAVQERIFRRQIALAKEHQLPVSIHTRDALDDTYRILKEEHIASIGGIMHSFSGTVEDAERFLDLGMHLSLSGVVTFKKATDLHEVAQMVPLQRLLVETDAPYLAPVPYRGRRNEPAFVRHVVAAIATLRGCSAEEIALQTWHNANRLFGLEA